MGLGIHGDLSAQQRSRHNKSDSAGRQSIEFKNDNNVLGDFSFGPESHMEALIFLTQVWVNFRSILLFDAISAQCTSVLTLKDKYDAA